MRKYLQITVVLGVFCLLVFIKNMKGNDDDVNAIGSKHPQIPTTTREIELLPTETPSQKNSTTQLQTTTNPTPTTKIAGKYKDGTYDGTIEDAFYGNIQVQAVIKDGKIVDIIPLIYPNDNRTSIFINSQALPMLKDEVIKAQNSQVDVVSGASSSSPAFSRSLASALTKAQN